jgi:hypothetical protein
MSAKQSLGHVPIYLVLIEPSHYYNVDRSSQNNDTNQQVRSMN